MGEKAWSFRTPHGRDPESTLNSSKSGRAISRRAAELAEKNQIGDKTATPLTAAKADLTGMKRIKGIKYDKSVKAVKSTK